MDYRKQEYVFLGLSYVNETGDPFSYNINVYVLSVTKLLFILGDKSRILRGTWFYDHTWQPMEEGYSTQVETQYLSTFLGHRLYEETTSLQKGNKPGKTLWVNDSLMV